MLICEKLLDCNFKLQARITFEQVKVIKRTLIGAVTKLKDLTMILVKSL